MASVHACSVSLSLSFLSFARAMAKGISLSLLLFHDLRVCFLAIHVSVQAAICECRAKSRATPSTGHLCVYHLEAKGKAGGTGGSNKSGANKGACWMPVIWELITPTYLHRVWRPRKATNLNFPEWHGAKPRTPQKRAECRPRL